MKLSSCRELKRQVQARAYELAADAIQQRSYRMRKIKDRQKRQVNTVESTPVAAVGVAPGKRGEFKLAVRLFRGSEACREKLLRGLGSHMREIDLATGVRYRPRLTLTAGGSIGHYKITAGTLGGFVEDDSNYYMMSNNHVFANSNQCFGGDPIMQPGPVDADGQQILVGNLHEWYPLSKISRNGIDAAIATFSDAVEFFEPWDYAGIGTIRKVPVADRMSVAIIINRGSAYGVTLGNVSAIELDGVQIK